MDEFGKVKSAGSVGPAGDEQQYLGEQRGEETPSSNLKLFGVSRINAVNFIVIAKQLCSKGGRNCNKLDDDFRIGVLRPDLTSLMPPQGRVFLIELKNIVRFFWID